MTGVCGIDLIRGGSEVGVARVVVVVVLEELAQGEESRTAGRWWTGPDWRSSGSRTCARTSSQSRRATGPITMWTGKSSHCHQRRAYRI